MDCWHRLQKVIDHERNRAMNPLSQTASADLTRKPIASGMRDPITSPENAGRLTSLLVQRGAAFEHRILPSGHELSQEDVSLRKTWWQAHGLPMTWWQSYLGSREP